MGPMAFLSSFLTYLIEAVILAVVAFLGIQVGKKLRANKNAKLAAKAEAEGAEATKNE